MLLVTGGTGAVGGEVVAALRARGEQVRVLTHSAAPALPAGVEAATGDLDDPESVRSALAGVHGMFLLPGYADMPGLLAVAREAGVGHVTLLSSGCVVGGDVRNAVTRYNVVSEAAVLDSGLRWTLLRPSGFHSNALRWLPDLTAGDIVREPFADVPVASIDPADIAAVAAAALAEPDAHAGSAYRLTGPQALLPADRLKILGAALGRDLTLDPVPDAEARDFLGAALPPEYADAFVDFFVAGAYDDSQVDPTLAALLPRPPRTYADWVETHLDAFRDARRS